MATASASAASNGNASGSSNSPAMTTRRPVPPSKANSNGSSSNGVCIMNGNGLFTVEQLRSLSPSSRRACEQLGYTIDDLVYRDFDSFYVANVPKDVQQLRFDDNERHRQYALEQTRARRQQIIEYATQREVARAAPARSLAAAARRERRQAAAAAAATVAEAKAKDSKTNSPRSRTMSTSNGSTSTISNGMTPSTPSSSSRHHHPFYSPLTASVSSFAALTPHYQQQRSRSPPATSRSLTHSRSPVGRPASGSQTARVNGTMPKSDKIRDMIEARERLDAWQQMEMSNLAAQQAQLQRNAKKMEEHQNRRELRAAQEWQKRKTKAEENRAQREELLQRAEASELQRRAEVERGWTSRERRAASVKAELGANRELTIQNKQRHESAAQVQRRQRVKRNTINREIAVHSKISAMEERFEESKARVDAEKEEVQAQRTARLVRVNEKAVAAIQSDAELAEQLRREHIQRMARHDALLKKKKQEDEAAMEAKRLAREKNHQAVAAHQQSLSEVELQRAEDLRLKEAQTNEILENLEKEKQTKQMYVMEMERLKEKRRQRNLRRHQRALAYQQHELELKVAAENAHMIEVRQQQRQIELQRERHTVEVFNQTRAHRDKYVALRAHGHLNEIIKEATHGDAEARRDLTVKLTRDLRPIPPPSP